MNRCFFILQNWKANVRTLLGGLTLFCFLFMFPGLVEAFQTVLVRTSDGGVYQIRFHNKDPRRGAYDLGDFVQDFSIYDQSGRVKLCPGNDDGVTWELYAAARLLAKTPRRTPLFDTSPLVQALKQAVKDQDLAPTKIAEKLAVQEVVGYVTSGIQDHTFLKSLNIVPKGGPVAVITIPATLIAKLGNIEIQMRRLLYAFWIASVHADTTIAIQEVANQKAAELWDAIEGGQIVDIFGGSVKVGGGSAAVSGDISIEVPLRLRLAAQVYQENAERAAEMGADLGKSENGWFKWLTGLTGVGPILEILAAPVEAVQLKNALEDLEVSAGNKIARSIRLNVQDIYDSASWDLNWHGFCSSRLKFTAAYLDVYEGDSLTYTVSLNSPPDSAATITINSDNSDAIVSPTVLTFTPSDWYKPKVVTLRAAADTDNINDRVSLSHTSSGYGDGRVEKISFTIVDRKSNNFPVSVDTIPLLRLVLGDDFRLDLANYFRDPENAKLVYWADSEDFDVVTALPDRSGSWITIKPRKIGSTRVAAGATDPGGLRVSQTFTVTVTAAPINAAPTALNTISDQTLIVGNSLPPLNVSNYFRDPDGDPLTYAAWSKPAGIVKVKRAGDQITIVPISAGGTTVIVRATDPEGLQVFQHISVTVRVPQIQQPPTSDPVSQSYDLAIQSISSNKRNLSPGEFFVLHITVRNNGPGKSGTPHLSYYHSSVQGRSPTDPPQLQGTVPLNPIAPGKRTTKAIRLQAPSIPRTYYYGAWLAANTDDTDIHNNVGTEVGVTVMATTVQTPNLPNTDIPPLEIPTVEVPPPLEIPKTEAPPPLEIPTVEVPPPLIVPTAKAPPPLEISTPEVPPPLIVPVAEAPPPLEISTPEVPPPLIVPVAEAPPPLIVPVAEAPPPLEISTPEVPPPLIVPVAPVPSFNWGFNDERTRTENICDRTQQVLNAILAAMDVDDCANVDSEGLDSITALVLSDTGITALQEKDFEGLSGLDDLDLHSNSLSSLSVKLFDGLRALKTLDLKENALRSLPVDVFDELGSLRRLDLKDNGLTALPVGVFDGLNALERLNLKGNQLTTLPKGIFDNVLDTLKSDSLSLDDSLKTTFGFSTTTQNAAEGDTVRVRVTLNRSLPVAIRVPYTIGGTATAADYKSLQPRSALLFLAGETRKEIVFTLLEDTDRSAETVLLTLGKLGNVKVRKSDGSGPNAKLKASALLNPPQQRLHTITVTTDGQGISRPMYWTGGNNKIYRSKLDGTQVQVLFDGGNPIDIALDTLGGKMYWVDTEINVIRRANLDGSEVVNVVTDVRQPRGLALDIAGGKIYWTDPWTNKIQRANLDGSGIEDLVSGLDQPERIALDASRGKMYWTDARTQKIQRANLNGKNVEDLVSALSRPTGIALDVSRVKCTGWILVRIRFNVRI